MKRRLAFMQILYLFFWIFVWNIRLSESVELPRPPSSAAFQNLSQRTRSEFRRNTVSPLEARVEQIQRGPRIRGNSLVPVVPTTPSIQPSGSLGPFTPTVSAPVSRIQTKGIRRFVPGELIIKLRQDSMGTGRTQGFREPGARVTRNLLRGSGTSGISPRLEELNRKYGVRSMERFFQPSGPTGLGKQGGEPRGLEFWRVYRLRLRSDVSPETVAEDYEKLAEVEYAEPNYLYTVSLTPNDPLFSRQYGLQRSPGGVDAVGAWDTETGDSRILIGLIDTGVDYNHEDLKGRIVKGPDYINDDSDPMDDNGHGTHLAGTIAAKGNNGKGVAGLCWSCRVLAIKVADSAGTATNAAIARGIVYAASHGAQVINLSLGGTDRSKTLELAVKYANSRGTILIAAIGNESTSQAIYPAAYPGVIAVGATDTNGNRAPFSNYGNYLSLMAPGVSIQSSYPNNRYQALSGTSMSAGFVSGIAALILSKNSSLSNTQVRNTLSSSADDISTLGKDSLTGYGRVNARKALGGGLVSGYVSIVSSKY